MVWSASRTSAVIFLFFRFFVLLFGRQVRGQGGSHEFVSEEFWNLFLGLARIMHRLSSRGGESASLTRRATGEHRRRTVKYVEETDRAQHRQNG